MPGSRCGVIRRAPKERDHRAVHDNALPFIVESRARRAAEWPVYRDSIPVCRRGAGCMSRPACFKWVPQMPIPQRHYPAAPYRRELPCWRPQGAGGGPAAGEISRLQRPPKSSNYAAALPTLMRSRAWLMKAGRLIADARRDGLLMTRRSASAHRRQAWRRCRARSPSVPIDISTISTASSWPITWPVWNWRFGDRQRCRQLAASATGIATEDVVYILIGSNDDGPSKRPHDGYALAGVQGGASLDAGPSGCGCALRFKIKR